MTWSALITHQSVQPSCINRFTTDAHVWLIYVGAEAKASCHSDGFVGQMESDDRKRWCVQPVTSMRSDDGLNPLTAVSRGSG